jgi:hypothetical protein
MSDQQQEILIIFRRIWNQNKLFFSISFLVIGLGLRFYGNQKNENKDSTLWFLLSDIGTFIAGTVSVTFAYDTAVCKFMRDNSSSEQTNCADALDSLNLLLF